MRAVGATRAQFLPEEAVDDNQFKRNAGFFITTRRAFGFILLTIVCVVLIVLLMYYYGPKREMQVAINGTKDIEELINETIREELTNSPKLPIDLQPVHYRLRIHPILDEWSPDNFTYTGHIKIYITCMNATNHIELHWDGDNDIALENVNLTTTHKSIFTSETVHQIDEASTNHSDPIESDITSTTITPESTTDQGNHSTNISDLLLTAYEELISIDTVYREVNNTKVIFKLNSYLEAGENYTLSVKIHGNISNNLVGLYRTSYRDDTQTIRWLLTTKFHPAFARRVFPCFDDPFFKSTFEISIARRTNMTALSNMPLRETEAIESSNGGWVWDHFHRSLPMSTHLISFTVCDLKNMRNEEFDMGPVINIWAPAVDMEKAKYALSSAQRILTFLEGYLYMKYPLSKIDMLAIPNFAGEPIASWGIMSFKKSRLLLDETSQNWKARQRIFTTLAYALARQWFGNLITMKSWSDLWLNEGIGSFLAETVQRNLMPNWQTGDDFAYRVMYKSFSADTLKSTRSVQIDMTQNSQIEYASNTVLQSKGSSLIRMLNYTLSETVFKKGLQYYVKHLAYESTDQDTLWEVLTNISIRHGVLSKNLTVKQFMESWILQKGYPYVTVERDYTNGMTVITQRIFIQDNVNNESLWYIPMRYSTGDGNMETLWMEGERNISLYLNPDEWVVFNVEQTGYYRVNYDNVNWGFLSHLLLKGPNAIPVSSRAQLLDDAFELAQMGVVAYDLPLQLTKYLRHKETNYVPWLTALNSLEELWLITSNYEYTGIFERFMLNLIAPHLMILGYTDQDNEPQNSKILRPRLVQIACQLRHEPTVKWAKKQFDKWMQLEDPDAENPLPYEYRLIIQCTSIKAGGWKEWDFLWNRSTAANTSPDDLRKIYLSLGCSHDTWLINKYLDLSLNGNISIEYIPYVWKSINHPVGIRTGFHFLRLNWNRVYGIYKDVTLVLNSICHDFLAHLSTEIDLEDLTQFFKQHQEDLKSIAPLIQSAVDAIKLRIDWKEKYLDDVMEWLTKNSIDFLSFYTFF